MGKIIKQFVITTIAIVVSIEIGGLFGLNSKLLGKGFFEVLKFAAASAAALTALSTLATALAGKKPVRGNKLTEQRLNKSIDPEAPRKIVFGQTIAPIDLRYWETYGTDNTQYDEVIAVATHEIESFGDFYLEDVLHTFDPMTGDSDVLGTAFNRTTRTIGVTATSLSAGAGTKWTSASSMTGMAFYVLKYVYSQEKWPQGFPNRITQVIKGAKVYDPRLDSTATGGSGTHRINDQSTWQYNDGTTDIGRNPALQALWYIIGWQINGELVAGMGVETNSINLQGFIQAANDADTQGFFSDCALSTGDNHENNLGIIESSCGGRLLDPGGLYTFKIAIDDTASIAVALDENDIVGGFEWVPSKKLRDQANIINGQYIDPGSLYQLRSFPEVRDATFISDDGFKRRANNTYAAVQDPNQAQKLAWIQLKETRFQGVFKAPFNYRAFQAVNWDVVTLSLPQYNFVNKLFRIISYELSTEGAISLTLEETDPSVYVTGNIATVPPVSVGSAYDARSAIPITGLLITATSQLGDGVDVKDAILVRFDQPSVIVDRVELEYKKASDSTWISHQSITRGHSASLIVPLAPSTLYDIRVRTVSVASVAGPYATGQGTTGNLSVTSFDNIGGATKPSDGATVGAQQGVNFFQSDGTTVYALDKFENGQIILDSFGVLTNTGVSAPVENAKITIDSAGLIAGAGGGQVTITGLGYTGDLNADVTSANTSADTTLVSGIAALTVKDGAAKADLGLDASGFLASGINSFVSINELMTGIAGPNLSANPELSGGSLTGYSMYDNVSGGHVTISAAADDTALNTSGYVLKVSYDGAGTEGVNPMPGFGGTVQIIDYAGTGVPIRPGKYVQGTKVLFKIIANIPVGRSLTQGSNPTGTGGDFNWLTPTAGTGTWETYIGVRTIGVGGTLGTTGFMYISGGTNVAFDWFIARYDQIVLNASQTQFIGKTFKDGVGNPLTETDLLNVNTTKADVGLPTVVDGADVTSANTSADTARVNAVLAATVQGHAQTGYDLTQFNGTTIDASSFGTLSLLDLDPTRQVKLDGVAALADVTSANTSADTTLVSGIAALTVKDGAAKADLGLSATGLLDFSQAHLNKGAFATLSFADWSTQITGTGKPADNATAGATLGTDLASPSGNVLAQGDVLNSRTGTDLYTNGSFDQWAGTELLGWSQIIGTPSQISKIIPSLASDSVEGGTLLQLTDYTQMRGQIIPFKPVSGSFLRVTGRVRVTVNGGGVSTLIHLGLFGLNKNKAIIQFSYPIMSGELHTVSDGWIIIDTLIPVDTYYSIAGINYVQPAIINEFNLGASGGQIQIDYIHVFELPQAEDTRLVNTIPAATVTGNAQTGFDLTTFNGTTIDASSFGTLSLFDLDPTRQVKLDGVAPLADVTSANTSADTALVSGVAAATVKDGAAKADLGLSATGDINKNIKSGILVDQGNGVGRPPVIGLETGTVRDGDAVTFINSYGQVPTVRFLPSGLTNAGVLTGDTTTSYEATNLTTTGFTASLKLKEIAGTPTTHIDTGAVAGTLDFEMEKVNNGAAWDDNYIFSIDIDTGTGPEQLIAVVNLYIKTTSGGVLTKFGTMVLGGAAIFTATKTLNVTGVVDFAGVQFAVDLDVNSDPGTFIVAFNSVTYESATAPAEASAVPAGASPVPYLVIQ